MSKYLTPSKLTTYLVIVLVLLISLLVNYYSNKVKGLENKVNRLSVENKRFLDDLNSKVATLEGGLKNKEIILETLKNEASKSAVITKKNQVCQKADELSRLPSDIVIRQGGGGDNGCNSISASWVPNTTKGTLDYINGFLDNYRKTGSPYWKHNSDVCINDAEKYQSILQSRYNEYLKIQSQCNASR